MSRVSCESGRVARADAANFSNADEHGAGALYGLDTVAMVRSARAGCAGARRCWLPDHAADTTQ